MGLFGITTRKERQDKAEREALMTRFKAQVELYAENNEYARMILGMLSNNRTTPSYIYNLIRYVQEGYVQNPNVFSVINKIIQPARGLPWIVYDIKDEVEFKRFKAFKAEGRHEEAHLLARKAFEVVQGKEINSIVNGKANGTQTWGDFVEHSLGYFLLTGNDYIYEFTPTAWKYATQLYCLPAQAMEIVPGGWREPIKGYKLMFGQETFREIPSDKVIHRKTFNPTFNFTATPSDYLYGLSPLSPLCRTVKRSNESIDAALALLLNGFPPGVLSQKSSEYSMPFSEKERDAIKEEWRFQNGGGRKANLPVIAPFELVWQQMGFSPVDMQLLEADKNSLEQIAAVYNVPLPIISMEAATLDNMKVAEKQLWEKAISPQLARLRDSLNENWVADINKAEGTSYWIDFDLKAVPVLQEEGKERSERIMKEMEHGLWTGNEARYLLDYETDENDELLNQKILSAQFKYSDVKEIPEGFKTFISVINSLSPLVANNVIGSMTEDELRELVGIGALPDGQQTINQMINNRANPQISIDQNGE